MIKTLLLAGASALALSATAAEAITFDYTGGPQTWTAPTTGVYQFEIAGAQGGGTFGGEGGGGAVPSGEASQTYTAGGLGAVVFGDMTVTAGQTFMIVAGGQGGYGGVGFGYGGGGGGLSGVIYNRPEVPRDPAISGAGVGSSEFGVAGGGGGAGFFGGRGAPARPGPTVRAVMALAGAPAGQTDRAAAGGPPRPGSTAAAEPACWAQAATESAAAAATEATGCQAAYMAARGRGRLARPAVTAAVGAAATAAAAAAAASAAAAAGPVRASYA